MTVKPETNFWKNVKKLLIDGEEHYLVSRIESYATPGFPDCVVFRRDTGFFTLELKSAKPENASFVRFSPHQISFHIKHKKNTFILVACSPKLGHFRLYPGSRILELVDLGLKLEPLACGLDSCVALLEGL